MQYLIKLKINHHWVTEYSNIRIQFVVDKFGVEDTVFCEVDMTTTFYNCTRSLLQTTKFAHMNGHWKDYNYGWGNPRAKRQYDEQSHADWTRHCYFDI